MEAVDGSDFFDEDKIIGNLAALLGVPKDKIKIVKVVSEGINFNIDKITRCYKSGITATLLNFLWYKYIICKFFKSKLTYFITNWSEGRKKRSSGQEFQVEISNAPFEDESSMDESAVSTMATELTKASEKLIEVL